MMQVRFLSGAFSFFYGELRGKRDQPERKGQLLMQDMKDDFQDNWDDDIENDNEELSESEQFAENAERQREREERRKRNRRRNQIDFTGMEKTWHDIRVWVMDHLRIIMPIVLAVCVLVTVLIAVNANRHAKAREEAQNAESADNASTEETQVPALELNAYPDVCNLINQYYTALANADADTISSIDPSIDDTEKIRIQAVGQYIDAYTTVDVYSKPGPQDGTYICYVYTKVKFKDYEQEVPGLQTMYVCTNEDGSLYINEGEETEDVTDYIKDTSLQDDVVDLNNKVTAEYNDLLAADEDLQTFLDDLSSKIDVAVGEALAAANGQAVGEGATEETTEESTEESGQDTSAETTGTTQYLQASDVINVRSSDSETADIIGQTEAGASYQLLESKDNGWSRISFNGAEGYVKTEYFTTVSGDAGTTDTTESADAAASTETADSTASASSADEVINPTKATAKDTVAVRSSEGGEQIGTVFAGDTLEVQMKMSDGWTRVTYNGQTAYVKSEYFTFS